MAKKTIKYSKNETTNVFENFEPWHYGEPAIPDNLYFLGTDEKAKGYQQYFDNNGYGFIEINAVDSKGQQLFEINSKPIRGCAKGSVVKAKKLADGDYDTSIWIDDDGKAYYKKHGTKTELKDGDGTTPKRLGIALVGGGGASGGAKTENWKNNCCNFDTTMPGGGGGGGAILWGIINLEKSSNLNKYAIKVGSGGTTQGASGKSTTLLLEGIGEIAVAGGGLGGSKGSRSGAEGGNGGSCWVTNDKSYFILCDYREGASLHGGSYNEVNENGDSSNQQYIGSTVPANEFKISFTPNGGEERGGSGQHRGNGATIEEITASDGALYLDVPGGNSFGHGGYRVDENTAIQAPTYGGGGMCWTHNDDQIEDVWASTNIADKNARCGAQGYWILFY